MSEAGLVGIDDDDETSCLPPGRTNNNNNNTKIIFALSDTTGVTAKSTIQKCLVQLDSCDGDERIVFQSNDEQRDDDEQEEPCNVQIKTFTYVREQERVVSIVKTAKDNDAFLFFTMADPKLRQKTLELCKDANVPALDFLGPGLDALSEFLHKKPVGFSSFSSRDSNNQHQHNNNHNHQMLPPPVPSPSPPPRPRRMGLSDQYYRRIEAVEFTLQADDGKAPWLLEEADVILVGVSRTGKTPLSVMLSQTMGLKVANVPLVLEVPPPEELLTHHHDNSGGGVDPNKVFCLTIAPSELKRIRTSRLERKRLVPPQGRSTNTAATENNIYQSNNNNNNNYNNRAYLLNDLKNARELAAKHNWTEIDVTYRAVEETASYIGELMNERFQDPTPFCI